MLTSTSPASILSSPDPRVCCSEDLSGPHLGHPKENTPGTLARLPFLCHPRCLPQATRLHHPSLKLIHPVHHHASFISHPPLGPCPPSPPSLLSPLSARFATVSWLVTNTYPFGPPAPVLHVALQPSVPSDSLIGTRFLQPRASFHFIISSPASSTLSPIRCQLSGVQLQPLDLGIHFDTRYSTPSPPPLPPRLQPSFLRRHAACCFSLFFSPSTLTAFVFLGAPEPRAPQHFLSRPPPPLQLCSPSLLASDINKETASEDTYTSSTRSQTFRNPFRRRPSPPLWLAPPPPPPPSDFIGWGTYLHRRTRGGIHTPDRYSARTIPKRGSFRGLVGVLPCPVPLDPYSVPGRHLF